MDVQRPDVISVSYKIIFDKKAGYTKFRENVFIVCCGNRPEHSSVAQMLPTPLIGRVLVVDVDAPKVDEWANWMNDIYGEKWDRKCYAFLKRFDDEGYLLKIPKEPETLDPHPEPRTWTSLAVLRESGCTDDTTVEGSIGPEVGKRLEAFLKVTIDVDELISKPEMFPQQSGDAKYMLSVMLASWLTQHKKGMDKSFPLIDKMSQDSREYLVITCMSISRKNLMDFLKELFKYNKSYKNVLTEITTISRDISI